MKILSYFSGLLPIIVFLIFRKRNKEEQLWVIFFYTLSSFLADNISGLLKTNSNQGFYIYSGFTIIEYSLFAYFFYLNFSSRKLKRFMIAGSIVFWGFAIYNLINRQSHEFDSVPASLESIFIICFCIAFFYEQLKITEIPLNYSSKEFWIVITIFLYMAATFILFVSTYYMSEEERKEYWSIALIANIVKNLLLCIAFSIKSNSNKKSLIIKSQNILEKQQ